MGLLVTVVVFVVFMRALYLCNASLRLCVYVYSMHYHILHLSSIPICRAAYPDSLAV